MTLNYGSALGCSYTVWAMLSYTHNGFKSILEEDSYFSRLKSLWDFSEIFQKYVGIHIQIINKIEKNIL